MMEKQHRVGVKEAGLRFGALFVVVALTLALYLLWFRPAQLTWGAREMEPFWAQNLELFSFLLAFLGFGSALLNLLVRPLTWARWLVALGAGISWLVVWYGGLPFGVGLALAALVLYLVCRRG